MKLDDAFPELNINLHFEDQPYSKILKQAGIPHGFIPAPELPPENTLIMEQKHTIKIKEVSTHSKPEIADGIVCKMQRPVAVQTADCVPVLTYQPGHVGALHCGWRGTADGMLDAYFEFCTANNFDYKKSSYILGPAIYPPHYQIRADVIHALTQWAGSEIIEQSITKEDQEHFQLDLSKAIILYLLKFGVPAKQIEWLKVNTFTHPKFHSYRRDGKSAGRNYSWIQHVS